MQGGQVLWGQRKYRSRSGSVRKAFSWLDNPGGARSWPKGKTQRSACVRERVAEAETSDHAHLHKQETVSQWGPGGSVCLSVCREGCSSLSKLSQQTAVEKRGCHRKNMAPRRGQDSRPSLGILERRLAQPRDIGQGKCFMRSTITVSSSSSTNFLASAAATAAVVIATAKQRRTVAAAAAIE